MKKISKRIIQVLASLVSLCVLFLIISFINHQIQLSKENKDFMPPGKMVKVNDHDMHVYEEGNGEETLVFMSGGGTSSPVLDFKSVYSLLSDHYKIVVIEKAGYGFSDITDSNRDIDTILSETREALSKADVEGPYVLLPHSMSGIEALYWSQNYPEEVTIIIGLDMAVPEAYENMNIPMFAVQLGRFAAKTGITRWIPNLSESDAITHGTLTNVEKELYKTVFYRRTSTKNMVQEIKMIQENAHIVDQDEQLVKVLVGMNKHG